MRKDKPSRTSLKVAFNIVTLGSKPGMEAILPSGIVDATRELLVASGTAGGRTVKWAQSQTSVAIYEAFDWLLPGQFEAFTHRKAFCERQVTDDRTTSDRKRRDYRVASGLNGHINRHRNQRAQHCVHLHAGRAQADC